MISLVQIYNVSQAFYPSDQYTVRDVDYANPRIKAGLFLTIIPQVLNYIGKTIDNSCTAQDGYCSRVITATNESMQNTVTIVEDYMGADQIYELMVSAMGMMVSAMCIGIGITQWVRSRVLLPQSM